jgi:hypothetical protein
MAQVRLLRDVLSDYAALNVADRHARPTLDLVRNLFSPALEEGMTSRDHFIFEESHVKYKYYKGACRIIESGALDTLVALECRYGSSNSFKRIVLRNCCVLDPEEVAACVTKFKEQESKWEQLKKKKGTEQNHLRKLRFVRAHSSEENGKGIGGKVGKGEEEDEEGEKEEEEKEEEGKSSGDGRQGAEIGTAADDFRMDGNGAREEMGMEVETEVGPPPIALPLSSDGSTLLSPSTEAADKAVTNSRIRLGGEAVAATKRLRRMLVGRKSSMLEYKKAWEQGGLSLAAHSSAAKTGFKVDYLGMTLDMNEADCMSIIHGSLLTDTALNFLASHVLDEELLAGTSSLWFGDTIVSAIFLGRSRNTADTAGGGSRAMSVNRAGIWAEMRAPGRHARVLMPFYITPELIGKGKTEPGHWVLTVLENYDHLFVPRTSVDSIDRAATHASLYSKTTTCAIYDSCKGTRVKSKALITGAVSAIIEYIRAGEGVQADTNSGNEVSFVSGAAQEEQTDGESCGYFVLRHAALVIFKASCTTKAGNWGCGSQAHDGQAPLSVPEMKTMGRFQCRVHMEKSLAPNLCAWLIRQAVVEVPSIQTDKHRCEEGQEEKDEEEENDEEEEKKGEKVGGKVRPLVPLTETIIEEEGCRPIPRISTLQTEAVGAADHDADIGDAHPAEAESDAESGRPWKRARKNAAPLVGGSELSVHSRPKRQTRSTKRLVEDTKAEV